MGYACPVCGDPQSDATHLANHLAFTALVRGGDHEDWLDENVPEWESLDESTLGERLVDIAEETDYPQVFEDTTGDHDHDDGRQVGGDVPDAMLRQAENELADADPVDTDGVLEEAMEMTRKRHEDGEDTDVSDADDSETE